MLKPIYIQQSWRLCFFRRVFRKLWFNTPARLRPAEAARRIEHATRNTAAAPLGSDDLRRSHSPNSKQISPCRIK